MEEGHILGSKMLSQQSHPQKNVVKEVKRSRSFVSPSRFPITTVLLELTHAGRLEIHISECGSKLTRNS